MSVNNSLTKSQEKPKFSAVISSEGYQRMINSTLRDPKRANRFIAAVTSAVVTNPTLQECDPATIISAALLGESLELSPSPQLAQYYLIPYNDKNKGIKNAQFQLGVNGYKQLAMRSGQYADIDAIEVRQGEYKGRDKETGKPVFEFIEDEDLRESTPIIGYLAYFELLNGFKKRVYFSYEKMLNHADKYSQAFNKEKYKELQEGKIPKSDLWKYSSPWYSGFDGMALKTVIRQLISKWGIMSIEMQDAYTKDMGVIQQDGAVEYVDNGPLTDEKAETVIDEQPQEGKKGSRLKANNKADEVLGEVATEQSEEDIDRVFGAFPNEA